MAAGARPRPEPSATVTALDLEPTSVPVTSALPRTVSFILTANLWGGRCCSPHPRPVRTLGLKAEGTWSRRREHRSGRLWAGHACAHTVFARGSPGSPCKGTRVSPGSDGHRAANVAQVSPARVLLSSAASAPPHPSPQDTARRVPTQCVPFPFRRRRHRVLRDDARQVAPCGRCRVDRSLCFPPSQSGAVTLPPGSWAAGSGWRSPRPQDRAPGRGAPGSVSTPPVRGPFRAVGRAVGGKGFPGSFHRRLQGARRRPRREGRAPDRPAAVRPWRLSTRRGEGRVCPTRGSLQGRGARPQHRSHGARCRGARDAGGRAA